jgi:exodeoxyribonuclease VII small subunit
MPKKKTLPEENPEMTFEVALEELEKTVRRLESENVKLDEAIELFRSGERLAKLCRGKLDAAQQEVDKIMETSRGEIELLPLDFPEE